MATANELEDWLQRGIIAAKTGQLEQARFLLLDVVEQDQANEAAWYWLYKIFDRNDDKRVCLENLIIINPTNQWAKLQLLEHLKAHPSTHLAPPLQTNSQSAATSSKQKSAADNLPRPVALKLVTAFWVGISVIFLAGGIISAGEWLALFFSGQVLFDSLGIFQFIDLIVTVSFVTIGLLGIFVAITLFFQSMIGFYGSILLALGLLLIGPTFSLIASPPNYATMICTGGISGMIVLLTLAGQSGLKNDTNNHG